MTAWDTIEDKTIQNLVNGVHSRMYDDVIRNNDGLIDFEFDITSLFSQVDT